MSLVSTSCLSFDFTECSANIRHSDTPNDETGVASLPRHTRCHTSLVWSDPGKMRGTLQQEFLRWSSTINGRTVEETAPKPFCKAGSVLYLELRDSLSQWQCWNRNRHRPRSRNPELLQPAGTEFEILEASEITSQVYFLAPKYLFPNCTIAYNCPIPIVISPFRAKCAHGSGSDAVSQYSNRINWICRLSTHVLWIQICWLPLRFICLFCWLPSSIWWLV